jgi:hypothetical protein
MTEDLTTERAGTSNPDETKEEISEIPFFLLTIVAALLFGIGVCVGTIATVRATVSADLARALREQRQEFEVKVDQAVERKDAELRKVFGIRKGKN